MGDRIKLEVMADGSVSLNGTRITLGKMWGIQKIVFSKYASKEWIIDALDVEKEIRAKAIDEFAEQLKNKLVLRYGSATPTEQYVAMQVTEWCNEIAEQMKGE